MKNEQQKTNNKQRSILRIATDKKKRQKNSDPGNNEKLYRYCFDIGLKENKIKFRDDRDLFTHIIKLF